MPWASFSMLDGKASAKTQVSLTRFLQSEVKIIHIIVQNNTYYSARSRWTKQQHIRMSCFSVTDPFLTTFYYVEKLNGIEGRGLKNLTYPYMGVGGQKLPISSLRN